MPPNLTSLKLKFTIAADALPGPTADRLLARTHALSLGADPAAVWRRLADDPALAPLGRALARAHESGTPVADAIANVTPHGH